MLTKFSERAKLAIAHGVYFGINVGHSNFDF